MITKEDIIELGAVIGNDQVIAEAILQALPIENVQGAGHSQFVHRVRTLLTTRPETDEELYVRINKAYGMWGAFLGHALEARGKDLDDCAKHVGLVRERVAK